jgi:ribosomal protein S18 acetylase RimI-like enzyme
MVRGKVHPEFRQCGLGTHILTWADQQAMKYGLPRNLIIRNEAFNTDCEPLYRKAGYIRTQLSYWMRHDLATDIPQIPSQFQHMAWNDQNASQFFKIYQDAFRERPGFPNLQEDEWLAGYKQDDDFRHDLSFLAFDGDQLVGFITAGVANFHQTPMGWIIQVGSHPHWRGLGVAAGLITKVMGILNAEGLPYVELHVNDNNPTAKRVYEKLGFSVQGKRAKYQKVLSR